MNESRERQFETEMNLTEFDEEEKMLKEHNFFYVENELYLRPLKDIYTSNQ
jgi:hypothetical protein